jgi:hypothetical protein
LLESIYVAATDCADCQLACKEEDWWLSVVSYQSSVGKGVIRLNGRFMRRREETSHETRRNNTKRKLLDGPFPVTPTAYCAY